ncbi:ZrgA family zinc uptake protein [Azomonas macrocytogenes]
MNTGLDNQTLEIELEASMMNLVGFEHFIASGADKAK